MKRPLLLFIVFITFVGVGNAQLLLTEDLYEEWESGQWEYTTLSTYFYNFNLNEEEVYSYTWDELQSFWIPFYRTVYTYNSSTQLTEQLSQSENNGWEDTGRDLYTYDGNGNVATYVHQFKSGSVWVNANRIEYTYDGNGNQIQAVSKVWDSNNSLWVNSSRGTYTYSNGVLTEELYESWDDQIDTWLTDGKVLRTYNGNGLLTLRETQLWENGGWRSQNKREYTYNSDSDLIMEVISNWNVNSSDWEIAGRIETIYGNNDLPYQEIAQSWLVNVWENHSRHTYTYDTYQSTEELDHTQLSIYPNPATETIIFNLDEPTQGTVVIYNAEGRIVVSQPVAGKVNRLPVSQLPTGNYFVQLIQEGKVSTGRFVKE